MLYCFTSLFFLSAFRASSRRLSSFWSALSIKENRICWLNFKYILNNHTCNQNREFPRRDNNLFKYMYSKIQHFILPSSSSFSLTVLDSLVFCERMSANLSFSSLNSAMASFLWFWASLSSFCWAAIFSWASLYTYMIKWTNEWINEWKNAQNISLPTSFPSMTVQLVKGLQIIGYHSEWRHTTYPFKVIFLHLVRPIFSFHCPNLGYHI